MVTFHNFRDFLFEPAGLIVFFCPLESRLSALFFYKFVGATLVVALPAPVPQAQVGRDKPCPYERI
jgi:hypothetical protein